MIAEIIAMKVKCRLFNDTFKQGCSIEQFKDLEAGKLPVSTFNQWALKEYHKDWIFLSGIGKGESCLVLKLTRKYPDMSIDMLYQAFLEGNVLSGVVAQWGYKKWEVEAE
jgi:hypothetical protein